MKRWFYKIKRQAKVIGKFFRIMKVRPVHFILPLSVSLISVGLGGLGLGLLVPLAKGVVEGNFAFVQNIPILGKIIIFLADKISGNFFTPNKGMFFTIAVLIFLSTALKYILAYLSNLFSSYWNGLFSRRIRVFVFRRLLTFGKSYFDEVGYGYITSVLTYSEELLQLLNITKVNLTALFSIGVHFIIMLIISWKLTLLTLIIFPVFHFSLRNIIKKIRKLSRRETEQTILINKGIFNILSGVPLIKAYSREKKMGQRFEKLVERARQLQFARIKFDQLVPPIQGIIVLTALLLMVGVVALALAKEGGADLAAFAVFFYVARDLLPKFGVFNQFRVQLASLKPPIRKVAKILESDAEKGIVVEGQKIFTGLQRGISLDNLYFSYAKRIKALRNISSFIPKGKMTAIVGPTGAGKTTILHLLIRFYNCPPNTIKVDGTDIREFKITSLREKFSLVSQDPFLFNDTLRNNIAFAAAREISEVKIFDILKKVRLYDFAKNLPAGLDTLVGDRGIKLSGGQKQRVAIARALIRNTEILMLDEATSSLDTETERLIQDSIEEAARGRTTIVVAHRLSTIKNSDKIIVVEAGRTVEQGSLEQLLQKKGKFYSYWRQQQFF